MQVEMNSTDKSQALSPSPRILIVEDDPDIRNLLGIHVQNMGASMQSLEGGAGTFEKICSLNPDLLILDWMLPEITGIEILRMIRKHSTLKNLPVLLLTARAHENDIIKGLDSGADDYVTKPFQAGVLKSRIQALLRRTAYPRRAKLKKIYIQDIVIDLEAHQAMKGHQNLGLTVYEYKVLLSLAENANKVLTRTALIQESKGDVSVVGRTIDNHVLGLRKKLGLSAECLETIRGVGYRLHVSPADFRSEESV